MLVRSTLLAFLALLSGAEGKLCSHTTCEVHVVQPDDPATAAICAEGRLLTEGKRHFCTHAFKVIHVKHSNWERHCARYQNVAVTPSLVLKTDNSKHAHCALVDGTRDCQCHRHGTHPNGNFITHPNTPPPSPSPAYTCAELYLGNAFWPRGQCPPSDVGCKSGDKTNYAIKLLPSSADEYKVWCATGADRGKFAGVCRDGELFAVPSWNKLEAFRCNRGLDEASDASYHPSVSAYHPETQQPTPAPTPTPGTRFPTPVPTVPPTPAPTPRCEATACCTGGSCPAGQCCRGVGRGDNDAACGGIECDAGQCEQRTCGDVDTPLLPTGPHAEGSCLHLLAQDKFCSGGKCPIDDTSGLPRDCPSCGLATNFVVKAARPEIDEYKVWCRNGPARGHFVGLCRDGQLLTPHRYESVDTFYNCVWDTDLDTLTVHGNKEAVDRLGDVTSCGYWGNQCGSGSS